MGEFFIIVIHDTTADELECSMEELKQMTEQAAAEFAVKQKIYVPLNRDRKTLN